MRFTRKHALVALSVVAISGLIGVGAYALWNSSTPRQPSELVGFWLPISDEYASNLDLRADGIVGAFPSPDWDSEQSQWWATGIHRSGGEFTATLTIFHDSGWWNYPVVVHMGSEERPREMQLDLNHADSETGQELAIDAPTTWRVN